MEIVSLLAILILLLLVIVPALYASMTVAPFLPTSKKDIDRLDRMIRFKKGMHFYELGAGDGRVMLEIAKRHPDIKVTGHEIHPLLVLWIKLRIILRGQRQRVKIINGSFFNCKFLHADVIYCFLMPKPMKRLGEKFLAECRPGTAIVSRAFPIPDWQPCEINGLKNSMNFFLYRIK